MGNLLLNNWKGVRNAYCNKISFTWSATSTSWYTVRKKNIILNKLEKHINHPYLTTIHFLKKFVDIKILVIILYRDCSIILLKQNCSSVKLSALR